MYFMTWHVVVSYWFVVEPFCPITNKLIIEVHGTVCLFWIGGHFWFHGFVVVDCPTLPRNTRHVTRIVASMLV
jgi:hypothetical protein